MCITTGRFSDVSGIAVLLVTRPIWMHVERHVRTNKSGLSHWLYILTVQLTPHHNSHTKVLSILLNHSTRVHWPQVASPNAEVSNALKDIYQQKNMAAQLVQTFDNTYDVHAIIRSGVTTRSHPPPSVQATLSATNNLSHWLNKANRPKPQSTYT